jgi:hypothetical protein
MRTYDFPIHLMKNAGQMPAAISHLRPLND